MLSLLRTYIDRLKYDQQGEVNTFAVVATSWILIMLFMAVVEIYLFTSTILTADNVVSTTLEVMKDDGGMSEEGSPVSGPQSAEELYNRLVEDEGLVGKVQLVEEATTMPGRTVNRGDEVTIGVHIEYELQSFAPIDYTPGLSWNIYQTGISRYFERPF